MPNLGGNPTCDISISVANSFPIVNSAGNLVAATDPIWPKTPTVDDNGYSLCPALFQTASAPGTATAPLLTVSISNVQNMDGEYYLVAYEPPNTSFSTGDLLFKSDPFTMSSGGQQQVSVYSPVATQVRRVNGTVQWCFIDTSSNKIAPVDTQLELYWISSPPGAMWSAGVWVTILRDIFTMIVSQAAPSNPQILPVTEASTISSIVNLCFAQTAGPYAKQYAIAGGGSFYDRGTYIPLEDYFDNQPLTNAQTLATLLLNGDPLDPVICFDMSAMVQVMLGAVGIPNQRVQSGFGYFNGNLIGWGECNNPRGGTPGNSNLLVDPLAPLPTRTWWNDHGFVVVPPWVNPEVPDINAGTIVDACGGPHYGTENPAAYFAAAVDTRTDPNVNGLYGQPGYAPAAGTPSSMSTWYQITSITAVSAPTLGATRGAATALDVAAAPKLFDGKIVSADVPAAMGAAAQATQLTLSSSRVVPGPASALHSVKLQDSAGRMLRGHLFVEQNAEAAVARLHNQLSTVDTSMGEFYDPGPTERLGPVSFVAKGGSTSVLWLHRNLVGIFSGRVPQETAVSLIENLQSQLEPQAVDALAAEVPKFGALLAEPQSVEVGGEVTLRASLDTSGTISFVTDPGALRLLNRSAQTITFRALQEGNYEVTVFSVHPKTLLASSVSSTINITGSAKAAASQ